MKSLINYIEEKQARLYDELGAFFAFSKKQFDEKAQKDIKYTHLGHGLIVPSDKAKEFVKRLEMIGAEGRKQDVEENGAKGIISREYFNFETQISCDTSDLMSSIGPYREQFPELFPEKLIQDTIQECWKEAIDNDYF